MCCNNNNWGCNQNQGCGCCKKQEMSSFICKCYKEEKPCCCQEQKDSCSCSSNMNYNW